MIRIDDRTVELDPAEQALSHVFDTLLDRGYGIEEAARKTRGFYLTCRQLGYATPYVGPEFWAYISDGTLTVPDPA